MTRNRNDKIATATHKSADSMSPTMDDAAPPLEHLLRFPLAGGGTVRVRAFDQREWTLEWYHVYTKRDGDEPRGDAVLYNEMRVRARFTDGKISDKLTVTMHVVLPQRLGREFFAGVDISPGAKTFLEFGYTRKGSAFCLVEIVQGAGGPGERWTIDTPETPQAGLLKQIDFPFPVLDRIELRYGCYEVPFLRDDGSIGHFDVPVATRCGAAA